MILSRILNVRLSLSLVAAVLMCSTTFLLLGGCPQPAPATGDDINNGTNNDGTGQDTINPGDGDQAADTAGDSENPDDTTGGDLTPGGSDDGDPGGSTDPGDSTDGDTSGGDNKPPPVVVDAGDMNGDGLIDPQDIRGFVLALMDRNAYLQAYPNGNLNMADANRDGRINSFDIDAFRKLIAGE